MTTAPVVEIGEVAVGGDHPPLFLPDIGTYFNQDMARGIRLIDGVADAGLAFLKGEVLHDAGICLDVALEETIVSRGLEVSKESYRRVIERKVVALGDYEKLFAHARSRGLRLALSVYDEAGLEFALAQGVSLLKVASSNVVHQPLIERAARSAVPVLIDTGRASVEEIGRAVAWFREAGGRHLVLEHSPPGPPAPASLQDLATIGLLQRLHGCPAGLSDHHAGDEMLYAAIALGAHLVEKGVCPDDVWNDQDVAHALPVNELAEVSRKCAAVFAATRRPFSTEERGADPHPARMGVIAARDLAASHGIGAGDLAFAFPRIGIGVEDARRLEGARLARAVAKGKPITWDDIERSGP